MPHRIDKVTQALSDQIMLAGLLPGTFTVNVSFPESGTPTAEAKFLASVGQALRQVAQNVINGFDFSDAAQQAREDALAPERTALRQGAQNALDDLDAYLAIADTATAAQVRAATKRLAQIMKQVIKRLAQID